MSLACPLCAVALNPSTLEAHLREELLYPAVRCLLCRLDFASLARAQRHFAGPLAAHPGHQPQLLDLAGQPEKEQRLLELVRLAKGGEEAAEKRLCVCGHCRLVCREPPVSQPGPSSEALPRPSAVAAPPPSWTWREPVVELAQLASEQTSAALRAASPGPWAEPEDQQTSGDELASEASEAGELEEAPEEEREPESPSEALKPGQLSCRLCGAATSRRLLRRHASECHSGAASLPFRCGLCDRRDRTKPSLAHHQRAAHGVGLTEATFSHEAPEGLEAELVERCFGAPAAASAVPYSRVRCKPCGKDLDRTSALCHVATAHLRRPLHNCRLCDYASTGYSDSAAKKHLRLVHRRLRGPDTLDSSERTRLEPQLRKLFEEIVQRL